MSLCVNVVNENSVILFVWLLLGLGYNMCPGYCIELFLLFPLISLSLGLFWVVVVFDKSFIFWWAVLRRRVVFIRIWCCHNGCIVSCIFVVLYCYTPSRYQTHLASTHYGDCLSYLPAKTFFFSLHGFMLTRKRSVSWRRWISAFDVIEFIFSCSSKNGRRLFLLIS